MKSQTPTPCALTGCQNMFKPAAPNQRFCSNRCLQRAYRARRRQRQSSEDRPPTASPDPREMLHLRQPSGPELLVAIEAVRLSPGKYVRVGRVPDGFEKPHSDIEQIAEESSGDTIFVRL